jgi:threonine/homoserine/homoserine lactone efflux protein
MDVAFYLKGLVIGFSIAAPVGPIGVLCIRRTLAEGRAYGFVSGLGAASADAFYGSIAGLGLTLVSDFLVNQQNWLRLIGGAYLCYLGIKTFMAKPAEQAAGVRGRGLIGAYGSILFLTLTNPITILSFVAIFAGLGLGRANGDVLSALWLIAGVFSGSCLWWLILVSFTSIFRSRFNARALSWINRLSGTIIGGFGIAILVSLTG